MDPARYVIRIAGHLGPTMLLAFPGLACRTQGADTVLTGVLPDRSALYGILAEVEALGLDLVELRKLGLLVPDAVGDGEPPRDAEQHDQQEAEHER